MTYKKIVASMIEREAQKWLERVLIENGIEYRFTSIKSEVKMTQYKEYDNILWEIEIVPFLTDYLNGPVVVGGTVDDICGCCCSVIWDSDKRNILWMAVPETREALGITELKVA